MEMSKDMPPAENPQSSKSVSYSQYYILVANYSYICIRWLAIYLSEAMVAYCRLLFNVFIGVFLFQGFE